MIELLLLLLAFIVGFYVAWNIGANDGANAVGAPIGGRLLSFKKGILLLVLFVLLGAALGSGRVMETVGEGIVVMEGGENPLTAVSEVAIIALFSAGFLVTISTRYKIPVSTSQSIVGAVIGAGLFLSYGNLPADMAQSVSGVSVDLTIILEIFLAWILTPLGSALIAFVLFQVADKGLRKIGSPTTLTRIFRWATVLASAFAAFSLGANTVGNATGLIFAVVGEGSQMGQLAVSQTLIGLFGGVAVCIGAITYSHKVIETVGEGITSLRSNTAFAAQFGAAITVFTFSRLGIPVSTSEAIVGGVAGVGLVRGAAAVSKKKLGKIGLTWVMNPLLAAGFTFAISWVVIGVIGV